LPPGTRLLYVDATVVVDSVKHDLFLPAVTADEISGEVPTAVQVWDRMLGELIQRYLREIKITDGAAGGVVKELKRSLHATRPSISPNTK
jgi:hypothetical protein